MHYEVLQSDDDLRKYSEQTEQFIHVALPLEYLRRSKVVVYKNKDREIIAGYCLALLPPFRSLLPVPKSTQDYMGNVEDKVLEMNGVWIAPNYRKRNFAARFWLKFVYDLYLSGKSYFLYSYSSDKERLGKAYTVLSPKRIWCGNVQISGMDKSEIENVEVIRRKSVPRGLMRHIFGIFKNRYFYGSGAKLNQKI